MTVTRQDIAREVHTQDNGTAYISASHPSAEIRALTPEIKKAFTAFEEQNSAAAPLVAERQELRKELAKLRASRHPTVVYDEARDDELAREIAKLDEALRRNALAAQKLAVDYLFLVAHNPSRDKAIQGAAELALEAHEQALAALAAVEDALARREKFYTSANRPAEWKHHSQTRAVHHRNGQFHFAHQLLHHEVNDFPVSEVTAVAKGERVLSKAEQQHILETQIREVTARARANLLERQRRERAAKGNT